MKTSSLARVAVLVLLLGISSCYYIPSGYHGTARAGITVRDVPAYIASVALVVTGPDMLPIQMVFPPGVPQIDLDVPAGAARTFTLLLTTASATLVGEATVDLRAGETRDVVLTPKLGGTDIVIPDANNYRIVQISDMTGAGWIEKTWIDIGAPGGYDFEPWDVDFDDQGRIYIANYGSDGPVGGVIRVDDINHVAAGSYVNVDASGSVNTLAVDRVNGYVYYYYWPSGTSLFRKNINSPTIETDDPDVFLLTAEPLVGTSFSTKGIAVDEQGFVYLINNAMSPNVLKYDPRLPQGSRVVASTSVEVPWDIAVKDGMVLVSDQVDKWISIFDLNLNPLVPPEYTGPVADPFVGPERFLGALGLRGIYLVDENNVVTDRLVYMQDPYGAGWTTYGSMGAGVGQFNFFSVP
jgi:hypothetical protein